MSEIFYVDEVRDLPAIQFSSSGTVFEPSPAPTATLILPDNSTQSLTLTKQGTGTSTRYLIEDFSYDEPAQLEVRYLTTDTDADIQLWYEYITVNAAPAEVDLAEVLDELTAIRVATDAIIAQDLQFYQIPVSSNGDTRIVQCKNYTGSNALRYTSGSMRTIETAKLSFAGKTYPAVISGSAGAWVFDVTLNSNQTCKMIVGEWQGELAIYDGSDEEPELATFTVTVEGNI